MLIHGRARGRKRARIPQTTRAPATGCRCRAVRPLSRSSRRDRPPPGTGFVARIVTKAQALEDIWSLERLALRVRRDNRNHRADGSAPRGQVLRSHASPGPYRAQDKRMARVSEVKSL